ncbi:glycosyltransferase family 2 protein [Sphingobium yanoikuyae]|jgi:GT2 family glycosyltransferase|uniref:Glycosyltransferase family 2 protein n=1 Tax=Sphingobium yanoikuyae TaxID=13690 RepID=A0AA42WVJ0_SPHYA|nr:MULTISPECIES: glycosyltransferase family 2 protein [Sphingobium]MDH2131062.1 glycosyltransferase family 2 protein [Sphingobium yanoikuyae]MDH2149198.1 glycosyltransferase family 2 protein [Sphingobium yanoikuyae]MDH2166983.1 glycosyltransferase family 2 protein [Sphingobium yanoikuyae]PHP16958.1 glycosyl transferase [Sphingobium sp. IP1]
MRSKPINHKFQRFADVLLTASVHFDAFRADPGAYLTATKWWIKRKRVRARGQFAPLLSRSPRAYMLWALRQEQADRVASPVDLSRPIIALVDIRTDPRPDEVAVTLASLSAEGVPALLVGSPETPDLTAIRAVIDWAAAPWLMPLAAGDRIAPGATAAYRAAMADPALRLIYADDDLLISRRRRTPHFKPDWNSELFAHHDYLSGACVLRAMPDDLAAVADDPDWAAGLTALLASEGEVLHLRHMLHHRRTRPMARLPVAPIALARDLPPLSVLVPTRNRVALLRTCLEGVAAADYPDVEVIVVDNDSDDPETLAYLDALDPARHRVLRHSGPFNYSAINNRAVDVARGRLLCLLNNDIETTERRWLATLATQALRDDVGAVGARLLYPDGRIQHAGVVIGVGNAAGHAHRFLRPGEQGYFDRHSLPQFTMAVTAACLVVARDRFLAVGGLDERNFAVAFNDVDLCLRLGQRGWQSLYEPRATLIHHESVSRGLDQDPVGAARFAGELAALKRIWKTDDVYDPYHHPQLSRASERFAVVV